MAATKRRGGQRVTSPSPYFEPSPPRPISRSWLANWDRITPFFAYPPEIRKVIYTTNAIESLNRQLRVLKTRGSLPSDEALMKLLYLALQKITQRWTMPLRDWKLALNRFVIEFEGRVPLP